MESIEPCLAAPREHVVEKLAQQRVEAVPHAIIVERRHQQVATAHLVEHVRAIVAPRDRVAEPGADALGDRGFEQELLDVDRQAGEDLLGQIVGKVARSPGQVIERIDLVAPRQPQAQQLQRGGPALGPFDQFAPIDLARLVAQEAERLAVGKAYVILFEQQELAADPEARQRDLRHAAHRHDDRSVIRHPLDHIIEEAVGRG
ncbi:hypothetical protein ACFSTI_13310 [Rhizorhabdus histidinilytica]